MITRESETKRAAVGHNKRNRNGPSRGAALLAAAAVGAVGAAAGVSPLGSQSAHATPLYWDTNGTTAGSGGTRQLM